MEETKPGTEQIEKEDVANLHDLILFNDDFNTFDHVIESLVDICNHDVHQAEQCTYIAHYNGRCTINSGSLHLLKPQHDALCDRGLSVTIS